MAYNLTPTQEEAVRWLVEKTKSGELAEGEILYSFTRDGGVAVQGRTNVKLPDCFSRSTPEILDDQGLVHLRMGPDKSQHITLTGQAYEAVNSDFADDVAPAPDAPSVFNLHGDVRGDNARINIQSQDQSINVVDKKTDELFAELRQVVKSSVENKSEKEGLLSSIQEMEQADSKSSYLKAYGFFIGLAASHVELLDPFLGALWQLYQNL